MHIHTLTLSLQFYTNTMVLAIESVQNSQDLLFDPLGGLRGGGNNELVHVSDVKAILLVGAILESDELGVLLLGGDFHDRSKRPASLDEGHALPLRQISQDVQVAVGHKQSAENRNKEHNYQCLYSSFSFLSLLCVSVWSLYRMGGM